MHSMTVHFVETPLPFIASPVTPNILTVSMYIVILPRTSVVAAVSPDISTFPMFLPQFVLPLITAAIRPNLDSLATLKIVGPVTFINSPVSMMVYPESLGLAIHPLSLKVIFIGVCEFPSPALRVRLPLALILTPIRICLQSLPLPLPADPLSSIVAAGAEGHSGQSLLVLLLHLCLDEFEERVIFLPCCLSLDCSPR